MNNKIIAHIGCGYWGKNLVRNFSEMGVLSCVFDEYETSAQSLSEKYSVPIKTFEDILVDPTIKGVSIATPAVTHFEMAKRVLLSGKDVYVEKPITLDIDHAKELVEIAKEQKAVLMVGHLLRYHPVFKKLLELVQDGRIGDVQYVSSTRLSLGKLRKEENVLWSFSPHDISMVLAVAGAKVTSVSSQGVSFVTQGVEDFSLVCLSFENGVKSHIYASWMHPFKEQKLVVTGTKGSLVFEDSNVVWEEKLIFYPNKVNSENEILSVSALDKELIPVEKSEPLRNECEHFVESIEKQQPALTCGEEGVDVLKVLHAAQKSLV